MPNLVTLDVSDLEPPQPMERILETLRQLQPGSALKVQHRREPIPFYPMLKELGYSRISRKLAEDRFVIFIWLTEDASLEPFCQQAANRETES
ncbi:MAG: DUF2249 domain-containing protein [Motiliproteus sp.]